MHDDDARLVRLARAIADGTYLDWEAAAALSREAGEGPLLEALRDVAQIAWFHRAQRLAASPGPKPAAAGGGTEVAEPGGRAPDVPQRWGHLEIRGRLGEGVFGDVYRAFDTKLEREVALKLLRPFGAGLGSGGGELAPHLLQEARHLARLRHPNVVAVYGAEHIDGRVGIWMEYVRGRTLEDLLGEQGPFGAREAALIGVDLCRALTAVHRAELVHRDVKARNVVREEGGRIVLMDFGAGAALGPAGASATRTPAGTPVYLAPEIFKNRPATPQSDLYSLGVLLYHLVTGGFPIQGESLREIMLAHERGTPRLLREERPDLPEAFLRAIERALRPAPAERFPTAGQLEHALAATLV